MTWPPEGWCAQAYDVAGQSAETKASLGVSTARALVGLPKVAERALCYPHDTPTHAVALYAVQSRCALVAAGYLRCLGVEHPTLDRPYWEQWRVLDAVSRLERIGRDLHAWEGQDAKPEPGDVVVIGAGMGTHALICVGWDECGLACDSVDGGSGAIRAVTRDWRIDARGHGLVDRVMGFRRVHGVIRIAALEPTGERVLPPSGGA